MADRAEVTLQVPPALGALGDLHRAFEQLWRIAPEVPSDDRSAFALAVCEIVANVMLHAAVPADDTVQIELCADHVGVHAVVTDRGRPFSPPDVVATDGEDLDAIGIGPDAEHGRGLWLANTMATVTYERDDGCNRWSIDRP